MAYYCNDSQLPALSTEESIDLFRTAREFAFPGTGTACGVGKPLSGSPPHGDSRHSPLHGEIPEKNRIRPRSLPGKLPPAPSLARLPTGYRPDCPRPRAGEEPQRGRGGGAERNLVYHFAREGTSPSRSLPMAISHGPLYGEIPEENRIGLIATHCRPGRGRMGGRRSVWVFHPVKRGRGGGCRRTRMSIRQGSFREERTGPLPPWR